MVFCYYVQITPHLAAAMAHTYHLTVSVGPEPRSGLALSEAVSPGGLTRAGGPIPGKLYPWLWVGPQFLPCGFSLRLPEHPHYVAPPDKQSESQEEVQGIMDVPGATHIPAQVSRLQLGQTVHGRDTRR